MLAIAPEPKRLKRKMRRLSLPAGMEEVVVRLNPGRHLTDEQLLKFSLDNDNFQIEQNAEGELIMMPPAFGDTGNWEAEVVTDLNIWVRGGSGGKVFGPTAGFRLPNGAVLSPDASWISQEKLDKLPSGALHCFPKFCPDFVVEVRSHSDRLPRLQAKLAEYLANGAQLGWLIDPLEKQVFIYRPGQPVEHLQHPATLSGEPVLAGFTLDLARVW